jgi:hypothetical protein
MALAPFTFRIGFLKADLGSVADAVYEWLQGLRPVSRRSLRGPLGDALRHLPPLAVVCRQRALLVRARRGWTAVYDSGAEGGDVLAIISMMADRLACTGVIATNAPHLDLPARPGRVAMWGSVQFSVYERVVPRTYNIKRGVAVIEDGGRWEFSATGDPMPFEEVEQYSAKRRRDRLTPAMLERYCRALGIDLYVRSFYSEDSVLIADTGRVQGIEEFTLEEARKRLGLDPHGFG